MNLLFTRLRNSSYVRNVLTMFTGTALAQVIPIAVSPILTRLYGPEQFGVFAIYLGIITMAAVIATGRYEMAITLPENEDDSFAVFSLAVLITLGATFTSFVATGIWGSEINGLLGIAPDNPLVYLIPFGILTAALFQIFSYWTIYRVRFKHLAAAKIAWSGGIGSSQLTLALISQKTGLLVGQITGQAIGVVTLFLSTIKGDLALRRKVDRKALLRIGRIYRKFLIFSLPADFINSMASQLPLILLGFYFGTAVAGFYALTLRVLGAPVSLLGVSVLEVFKERASRDFRETGSCREIYLKTFKTLSLLAIGPFSLLFFIAPDLFEIVFGAEWREAGDYTRLLIALYFMRFISSPLSYVMYIAEKQQVDLIWQVCLLLVTTASIVIGGMMGEPKVSIALFATSYSAMYLIYLGLSYKFSVRS